MKKYNRIAIATWLALLCLTLLLPPAVRAEESQVRRNLFIFEMSPAMKKSLPVTGETLAKLFASNMDSELHPGDDIAVWTVDDGLHSATDLITSWDPEDAASYAQKVMGFVATQKYSRHASLTPIQPSLNRVVRNSQHLTVLIFCDSQAHITGTPYDKGINEIITNTAAQFKGVIPLVIVLRSYDRDYIGSSVNRAMPLQIPKFPTPKPVEAPPATNAAMAQAEQANEAPRRIEGPIVKPIPAMIIVGTTAGTNVAMLTNTALIPARPQPPSPAINYPKTNSTATNAATVTPTPAPPASAALPPPAPSQPAPTAVVPKPAASTAPVPAPVAQSNVVPVASGQQNSQAGFMVPLAFGLGALASALVIGARLLSRSRRPRSSLITSSMQDDRQPPPQK